MLQGIKNTAKNSIIYSIGNVSTKLVGLVLLPLFTNTKLLTVEEFGVLGVVDITIQILAALFGFSLYQAFFRWYWDSNYMDQRKSIFFTLFSALTLISTLLVISGSLVSSQLSMLLFSRIEFGRVIFLMLTCTGLQIISQLPFSLMRIEEKPLMYTLTNLFRLSVSLVLTILFLVKLDRGIEGIYEAQLWGHFAYFLVTAKFIVSRSKFSINLKVLQEMFIYSLPLAIASISGILLSTLDRYVLNYRATLLEVGLYTLAFRLTNTIRLFVVHSVQLAVAPSIFKLMEHPNHKQIYSRIMTYFSLLVVFASLFFSLFGMEIIDLFTTDKIYLSAYKIIPLLCLSLTFGTLKDIAINGLTIVKRTGIISVLVPVIAVLHLTMSYMLIPILGVSGAALSSVVSQFTLFIVVLMIAQKYYYIPYQLKRVAVPLFFAAILYAFGAQLVEVDLWPRITIKIVLLIVFPAILLGVGFLEKDEKGWVNGFIAKYLHFK